MSKDNWKHGVIDQVKYRKMAGKRKLTGREYHVQYGPDVSHREVKIYFNTNQFPTLPFCGPHPNRYSDKVLSKHYCLRFDPKLGHGICSIRRIICACLACK